MAIHTRQVRELKWYFRLLLDRHVSTHQEHLPKDENITLVRVPGAYELPLVARRLAGSKKFDAIVALGTVIRGGTAHFEYVAGEASSGLGKVAMESDIPVAFGVLTTENIEQAIERAGTKSRQ